jgi:hypothetical protein
VLTRTVTIALQHPLRLHNLLPYWILPIVLSGIMLIEITSLNSTTIPKVLRNKMTRQMEIMIIIIIIIIITVPAVLLTTITFPQTTMARRSL